MQFLILRIHIVILRAMPVLSASDASALFYRYRYHFFFGLIAVLSVINLTIDIMDVDAAQYASISLEMSQTGNYLEVYHKGHDYLDKPPLLFWLSSISILIFGNTNFAYKLPAVVFLWAGIWAIYKFGTLWYGKSTGIIAALIMATTQAFHLMTNDIRTDGLLTAFVILSVYFLSVYLKNGRFISLLIGGLCIGFAMLTKGPLGFIIPVIAIGGHLLITRQWKKLFSWQWFLIIPFIALVLAPMLYGLYTQFDLHPEKEAYGLKGPSGLKFYFWTQSFGRITGENTWENETSVFYFLGTILWDLAPWVLLFIPAFFFKIKSLFRKNNISENPTEWISLCGFVIPFIALSLSNYKLPHYIFPLFPFAAIITAQFLVRCSENILRWLEIAYVAYMHLFLLMALLILIWVFPSGTFWVWPIIILFYVLCLWLRKVAADKKDKLIFTVLSICLLFQFVLSLRFYPELLKYQSTSLAGKLIAKEKPVQIFWHNRFGNILDYYAGDQIPQVNREEMSSIRSGSWIFTDKDGLNEFPEYTIIQEYDDYPVTLLSRSFLDPKTRETKLKKTYIIEVK